MARKPSGTSRSTGSTRATPKGAAKPTAAATPAPESASGGTAGGDTTGDDTAAQSARERIIAAFLGLLAEKSFESIGLAEVAGAAGVTLADLRDEFSSTLAIHAAHVKAIDRQVLSVGDTDVAEESPRERLFDVMMRRLDALGAHKAAVRSLLRSARRNPPLALALNHMAVRSQQWMLAAANAHLGRMDEARRHVATLKRLAPESTIALIWDGQPQKDTSRLSAVLEGLRLAGLEER